MAYFHCPACGHEQPATESKIGRSSTCPKCNAVGKVVRELAEVPLPLEGYPAMPVPAAVADETKQVRRPLSPSKLPSAPSPLPSAPPPIPTIQTPVPKGADATCSQIRPWVRYWARVIDLTAFSLVFGVAAGVLFELFPPFAAALGTGYTWLWSVATTCSWVFVEALFLSQLGATPAKSLLKTQVRSADQTPMSYTRALGRSWRVWVYGIAMGLPLIPLYTMMKGQAWLVERKTTRWDTETNCVVCHETIGMARIATAISIIAGLLLLIGISRVGQRNF